MTAKEILLEQMAACHNKSNWFVSINSALEGLTAEQAILQDSSSNNSIRKIVNHLIYWNGRYLNRFKGIENPKAGDNNDYTFESESIGGENEDWKTTKTRLENILAEFCNEIEKADESKLTAPAFEGTKDSWYSYLTQITIHNAYHIGQIVTIRKQQDNWDRRQGVS
jgi:uncharacterized damage-inducible protein DinB